jgi:hypothetical protein
MHINNSGLSVKTSNIHLFAEDTVMYAIAPPVDQVLLELQSDFVALHNALVRLILVLIVGKAIYMLFSNSQNKIMSFHTPRKSILCGGAD